ncbi:MAG TPA: phosphatase PAP2 family protein [Candidatus Nanoarchaeia archaeon]|nr:phosphatase PAP2 family protein [Candidatus Nanoarchaeia archaeon]
MKNKEIIVVGIALVIVSFLLDNFVLSSIAQIQYGPIGLLFLILGNAAIMLSVLFLLPVILLKKKRKSFILFLSLFFSSLIGFALKLIIMRPRPFSVMVVPLLNIVDYSFPSLHAFIAFSLAHTASKILPRYRVLWYGYAVFIAFSRIYLQVHYFSDVVAGAFFGIIVSKLVMDEWLS